MNSKTVYLKLLLMAWCAAPAHLSVVMTAQGAVRGEAHQGYTSYNGIPYASVTDAGRFKRGGLAPRWAGTREAPAGGCSRGAHARHCLTLDVHAPQTPEPAPVLAWLAAGGRYWPGKLVQQGIFVVVINHRLGPQGFLCLDDERMPGNAGVKDVVLALRWVRDNVSAFKGDPHKVVVGGQGFAAAMVEALLLTPMAQDLFHGAIMQSGSTLCPWAFNYDARERGLMLGQKLDDGDDEYAAIMNADDGKLAAKSDAMDVPYFPFAMCVEKSFKHEERLFSEPPNRLLLDKFTRKVPLIIGYNSDEAYIFLSLLRHGSVRAKMTKDLSILLPEELQFSNEDELRNVVKQLKDSYLKNNNYSLTALLDYHRDAYFTSHIDRSARRHAASSLPVYYYRFSHAGAAGVGADRRVAKRGAAHSDELAYLFPETTRDLDEGAGAVQRNFITLWTNFVKYLEPTPPGGSSPRWEPVDNSNPRLLDISAELAMRDGPGKMEMWDDIYERFYYAKGTVGR